MSFGQMTNDHAVQRGLRMKIDNIPNFLVAESMRSRFEREDTLAGVMGLHGWAMFSWHNWRRIGLWMGFTKVLMDTFWTRGQLDGVRCHPIFPWNAHCHGCSTQATGMYIHLARDFIMFAPVMTVLLSLDSHIFLRLITSFEPLFLMANFMAERTCWRIHAASGSQHAKELALHDFGVAEWAYVILGATLHFSSDITPKRRFKSNPNPNLNLNLNPNLNLN